MSEDLGGTAELTIPANPTAPDPETPSQEEHELAAAWDRANSTASDTSASGREANGRFKSADTGTETVEVSPEEGAGAEEPKVDPEAGTEDGAAAEIPLPANMQGMEKAWAKIPADVKAEIAPKMAELHQRASDLGRNLASWKPVNDVLTANKHYFDGTVSKHDPAQAIGFLFNVQREMDVDPVKTILDIADRYEVRQLLAQALGTVAAPAAEGAQGSQELRREIAGLKQTILKLQDPAAVDSRIDARLTDDRLSAEISRFNEQPHVKPLIAAVAADMPYFIGKAWAKLGKAAAPAAVLEKAFDMAVQADPDLRAKSAAAKSAAASDQDKAKAATAAKSVNVKSNATGKARELTESEELGQIFDRVSKK